MKKQTMYIPHDFTIDVSGRVKLANIPQGVLRDRLLGDGRVIGLLIESIVAHEFKDLTQSGNAGSGFDLLWTPNDGPAKRIQCKTSKSRVFDAAPSYMKGKGRVFSREKFFQSLDNIDAFMFVDVGDAPVFKGWVRGVDWVRRHVNVGKSGAKIYMDDLLHRNPTLKQEDYL